MFLDGSLATLTHAHTCIDCEHHCSVCMHLIQGLMVVFHSYIIIAICILCMSLPRHCHVDLETAFMVAMNDLMYVS